MRDSKVARNYAEALYEIGERHDRHEAFVGAFDELGSVLADEPRIRTFLETPKVEPEQKKRILTEALEERVPPLFLNFLLVVVSKRRQALLSAIAHEYHAVLDERRGRVHVQVTLAREPDRALREAVVDRLSRMLDRTVVPHIRVAPEILGGIIVRYEDRVLDGSLRRRLRSMRSRLMERPVRG